MRIKSTFRQRPVLNRRLAPRDYNYQPQFQVLTSDEAFIAERSNQLRDGTEFGTEIIFETVVETWR